MPHCIIEHANDLTDLITPEEIMDTALSALLVSELFEIDDIKIRSKDFAYYQRGKSRHKFIHITLKILSGRNLQQKKNLASLVLKAMDELPLIDIEITIDVQEMDADSYLKLNK